MKLKKMMMSGLCACLMLGTLAGCGSAQGDDAQSEDPTVILVGVSPDYPPYESLDSDGNIVGFDADMLVELEKYMNEDGGNYDLQFRQMEFNAVFLSCRPSSWTWPSPASRTMRNVRLPGLIRTRRRHR